MSIGFAVRMGFFEEIRSRAGQVYGPVVGICLLAYFSYHAVQGDRGLMAWWKLQQRIDEANKTLMVVSAEKQTLEKRVRLLQSTSLDPDMLEERARVMLNFGHIDDIVALDEKRRK